MKMKTLAIKTLVVLAAVVALAAICQIAAWTPSAEAAIVWLADPNDPNAPSPAPEMVAPTFPIRHLAADPNDPNGPPQPELT
jgi:hypothetical protein